MGRSWTFGQKVGLGYGAMVILIFVICSASIMTLRSLINEKDRVISVNGQLLINAERLLALDETKTASFRGYILTRDDQFLEKLKGARDDFSSTLNLMETLANTPEERDLIGKIGKETVNATTTRDRVEEMAKKGEPVSSINAVFKESVLPAVNEMHNSVQTFVRSEEQFLKDAKQKSTDAAAFAVMVVIGMAVTALLFAVILAFILGRLLSRQVGSAVQHIQSSSNELQAAASQQTTGTKEQVTSMNEISTTIKELLSTSRQIAESAQRVAHIAGETAAAARSGDLTVQKAQEAIGSIKRQVDVIVAYMLDLGKKSHQIGGILEIINELAEQTNILAINATIEAAGAGEVGKRFVVVAEEIRKLADRVSGSTKDIRTLIEEIRGAVNTTVLATESGSKAVDAGARQFSEVTTAFKQIGTLVGTTTEAAREIELSTKQQTTSVEQVSTAVSNIAQTAKESEVSSTQTLQTVSELATLSKALTRLIQSEVQV